jgi:hypothetical protein
MTALRTPRANSTSVRIDKSTRDQLQTLRRRLLDRSFTAMTSTLPGRGISMAVVVGFAVKALERELDDSTKLVDMSEEE